MDMQAHRFAAWTVLWMVLGSGAACSQPAPTASAPGAAPSASTPMPPGPRPAHTLAIPGADTLPPGHPPLGGATGGLGWDTPEAWVAEPPASNMRKAQYRVPGPGGDGECVVFYFGPGQGGDPSANAQRWAGQFVQPDGRASTDAMQTRELDGTTRPVQVVEITGTYNGGMTMTDAPAQPKPGYMLLGAIARGDDAPWFFKFTGPEATVRSQREAFYGLLRSLRAGG